MNKSIYTIGHSTRSLKNFLALLKKNNINQIVDIRTIPRSQHNPQFNKETIAQFLRNHQINYRHMKGLGGLRKPEKNSVNTGWQNASFRGFADYMQTNEFAKNLQKLLTIARKKNVVLMCAEAVPWRCHRSLIADALALKGYRVNHIISGKTARTHVLTPFLRKINGAIIYP